MIGINVRILALGNNIFAEVFNKSVVARIAAVTFPGHGGVVLETVEPASDERVAGLHFVIEEAKGQTRVHSLDPEGETAELDGKLVEIDAAKPAVTRRTSLAPCEGPSGLAIDVKNKKLFSVCGNKMMAVTDIATMKTIATPPIGSGTDGAGFDSGLAFSSNGEGTMTIVKPVNGKYEAVDTVTTERGARTMTVDPTTHRIYMLAAEYGPAPAAKEGQKAPRPAVLPDSFHVIVIGK